MIRDDANDQIYKTKDGKWKAVVNEIEERHETGQPILVGTVSVEVSEMLSEQFKKRGIKHEVLNAKPEYAEKEGETVAQAGRLGAVTIATNMAGRGVDIKLGGDPEQLAESELRKLGVRPADENYEEELNALMPGLEERCKAEGEQVIEAGGLFICGTERHESRRIDNQLRGRAGRQGDPGASRFFLSAQDDLVRLFAGDRIFKILDRLGPTDDEGEEYPLEAKMLSKQIESAQKKVEEQNYLSRKRVLEYDDVMNEQRRVVYKYRREVLEGRDIGDIAREQVAGVVATKVNEYTASDVFEEWDLGDLEIQLGTIWPVSVELADLDPQTSSREQVTDLLTEDALAAYDEREEEFGEELMRALERHILLQIIDVRWKEHLAEMDYMREGIHLRGFAQIDPLVAYKNEGYQMFQVLMDSIWEEFARLIFHVDVEIEPNQVEDAFGPDDQPADINYSGGAEDEQPSALAEARAAAGGAATAPAAAAVAAGAVNGGDGSANGGTNPTTVVKGEDEKIGRNDPCWCGSGKKFKKCHGA
jgi:preprotein translocase subunit SecA